MNDLSRKELLNLPVRAWNKPSTYDSILVVPSGKKHGSGYHLIAVIGCISKTPIEIAAYCDDISWIYKAHRNIRNDMPHRLRASHIWGNGLKFEVGHSLSSTDITVLPRII